MQNIQVESHLLFVLFIEIIFLHFYFNFYLDEYNAIQ